MPLTIFSSTGTLQDAWRAGESLVYQHINRELVPVEQVRPTTYAWECDEVSETLPCGSRVFEAPIPRGPLESGVKTNSVPLQIWEGTVIEVDADQGILHVVLDAKLGNIPRHTGEIELEWVSEQDRDLVVAGAVFYLTLFKRTFPSVENSQELRFRRRPAWSATQLKQVSHDAEMLASKMKARPIAL